MANTIKPEDLGKAITEELTIYHRSIVTLLNEAGREAVDKLRKLTKATAPRASGSFRRHIAVAEEQATAAGDKRFLWYVKPPDHRLTHLLVHGHATRSGGRTKGDPFLHNALDAVLPEYEDKVKEALQNGK